MDEYLMTMLLAMGYQQTSHHSEGGEIVKETYANEEGHTVDLYHKKFCNAFLGDSSG